MKRTFLVIILMGMMSNVAIAQPVYFADANLKACVEAELGITDPHATDMLALTSLYCSNKGITDLTGLEYATNLTTLYLHRNQISNISPLAGMLSERSTL